MQSLGSSHWHNAAEIFLQVTLRRMPARRPYHHGALRNVVLDAARFMVSTDGTAALSLRALAREVGVSHPAIYNQFADREALLAELGTEALLEIQLPGYCPELNPDEFDQDVETNAEARVDPAPATG